MTSHITANDDDNDYVITNTVTLTRILFRNNLITEICLTLGKMKNEKIHEFWKDVCIRWIWTNTHHFIYDHHHHLKQGSLTVVHCSVESLSIMVSLCKHRLFPCRVKTSCTLQTKLSIQPHTSYNKQFQHDNYCIFNKKLDTEQ